MPSYQRQAPWTHQTNVFETMSMKQTIAERVAEAVSRLDYAQLDPDIVHGAKRILLDTLAAMLAGVSTEEVQIVCRAVQEWGGAGDSPVWGTAYRFSAPDATLVNGTAAHAREVDDFGGCGHSGAVVVPAVLAAAPAREISGKDILTSIVAGYEVAVRATDAVGGYKQHNADGWHSTGTAGAFGAAAAAARMLGLDQTKTTSTLGLAGTYTGGVWAFIVDGAMSKRLHAGKAAQTGLVAAQLAAQGFTGPGAIFEDTWGSFLNTYASETADPEALLQDLGQNWNGLFRSGFKPYACCRGIHSSLDAAFNLKEKHGIQPEDIEQIIVRGSEQTVRQLGKVNVETILDAQFSIPYSLALVFIVGRASLDEYEGHWLYDAGIKDFARRVHVVADRNRALTEEPAVEIHLSDGSVVMDSVAIARGDSRNPMSDAELQQKFNRLASRRLKPDRLEKVSELVWHLEELDNASVLASELTPK